MMAGRLPLCQPRKQTVVVVDILLSFRAGSSHLVQLDDEESLQHLVKIVHMLTGTKPRATRVSNGLYRLYEN